MLVGGQAVINDYLLLANAKYTQHTLRPLKMGVSLFAIMTRYCDNVAGLKGSRDDVCLVLRTEVLRLKVTN